MEQTLQALLRQRDSPLNEAPRHRYRYSASSTVDDSTELPGAADNSIVNDDVATFDETWPQDQDADEDEVDGLATITNTERGSSSFYGKLFCNTPGVTDRLARAILQHCFPSPNVGSCPSSPQTSRAVPTLRGSYCPLDIISAETPIGCIVHLYSSKSRLELACFATRESSFGTDKDLFRRPRYTIHLHTRGRHHRKLRNGKGKTFRWCRKTLALLVERDLCHFNRARHRHERAPPVE